MVAAEARAALDRAELDRAELDLAMDLAVVTRWSKVSGVFCSQFMFLGTGIWDLSLGQQYATEFGVWRLGKGSGRSGEVLGQ